MLFEAQRYYDHIENIGIESLDDLEASLETKSSTPLFASRGGRQIELADTTHSVTIERRTKDIHSLLRKVLVRDDWDFSEQSPYNDIYAESYIFSEDAQSKMREEARPAPCRMTDKNNTSIETYIAPEIVHDFITELVQKAHDRGEKVDISQFKESPKNGAKFDSGGRGGGGEIRFCKFYIKHTSHVGEKALREVQMFLPKQNKDGVWVSGKVDYEQKKTDDERYALARLFTHGNVYTLIELLFPYSIYGKNMRSFLK
jgi:hypothetical protein